MMDEIAPYKKSSEQELDESPIQFFPVRAVWLEKLRARISVIPTALESFWTQNGYGFVKQAAGGGPQAYFENMLMSPSEIADILGKKRFSKHLVQGDETAIPFFKVDDDIYFAHLANGPHAGSVVTYGKDRVIVSNSMEEFVRSLLKEPEFYLSSEVVPSQTRATI